MPDIQRPGWARRWRKLIAAILGRTTEAALAGPTPTVREFAGYRIEALIGRGSLGQVYRALDLKTGTRVALKTMPFGSGDASAANADVRQRFLGEVSAARRLDHPDIVRILAAGEARGTAWIAMELVEGHDLSRHTRAETRLPLVEVVKIGARLADALAHSHRQGVVHRDLKPANVVIDPARERVKLADFGVARLHDAARTRTGLALGSPAYMAPEQLAGADSGPGVDIYALGVLLFELICARPPFAAASLGELMQQVAHQPAPDLRTFRPDAPAVLADAVARALAKHPRQRPSDASEMARLLKLAAAAMPTAPP